MKVSIKSNWLVVLMAIYFVFALNLSFWRFAFTNIQFNTMSDVIFLMTIPVFMVMALSIVLVLLIWPYFAKPILIFLLVSASVANYGMYQLGIYIDSNMIRNIVETNSREAADLITVTGIIWIVLGGVLPSLIVLRMRIIYQSFFKEILYKCGLMIVSLIVIGGIALLSYKEYASFGRNNRQVIRLISPNNYLYSTGRYLKKHYAANQVFTALDINAKHSPFDASDPPAVFIIVLGETARSMNFSLNGYPRETNPQLAQQDMVSFKQVTSCGTATAISVPCLFSNMNRQNFDADRAKQTENILDLLKNSGYEMLWRENDDGCKGVCQRIKTEDMVKINNPKFCDGSVCFDEVLLEGLEDYLAKVTQNTVIVLHTIGSHGPTYYKRYPSEFKKFTPTCDTAEIQSCSKESIINTYDNTILYTDHVVSSTIDILKKFPQFKAGLMYVSDHGESLGENNIYLHGLPYAIAPKEQTHVPLMLWLSETMKKEDYLDIDCLKAQAETLPISHDYIFHSLLRLLEVKSNQYDANLDFFKLCQSKSPF